MRKTRIGKPCSLGYPASSQKFTADMKVLNMILRCGRNFSLLVTFFFIILHGLGHSVVIVVQSRPALLGANWKREDEIPSGFFLRVPTTNMDLQSRVIKTVIGRTYHLNASHSCLRDPIVEEK